MQSELDGRRIAQTAEGSVQILLTDFSSFKQVAVDRGHKYMYNLQHSVCMYACEYNPKSDTLCYVTGDKKSATAN